MITVYCRATSLRTSVGTEDGHPQGCRDTAHAGRQAIDSAREHTLPYGQAGRGPQAA